MNIISFFISSFIIIVLPGTGVIYTISTGITKGKRASIFAALGCTAGIIPHLCMSIALYSLILQMNAQIFNAIKIVGAFYLLYLGIGMILSKSKLNLENTNNELNIVDIVRKAILINLLNPKLTIFFFSFLPQYVDITNKNSILQYLFLGLVFMLLTLVVFICYGLLAGSAKKLIENSPHTTIVLQQCFGIIFVFFAIQLGVSSLI